MPPIRRLEQAGALFTEDFSDLQYLRDNFTVGGYPTVDDSPWGRALKFDGTNPDSIVIGPRKSIFNGINDFSLVIKFKWIDTGIEYQNLALKTDTFFARMQRSTKKFVIVTYRDTIPSIEYYWTDPIKEEEWYTVIVAEPRNGIGRCYLNGIQVTTQVSGNQPMANNDNNLSISPAGNAWNGSIKEFSFWPRTLSAQEAIDYHNGRLFG